MDLSNYDFDNLGSDLDSAPKLEPGIYDLHFAGFQELNGKNNWKALKIIFTIGETNRTVGHAFCVEHDDESNVKRGRSSLKKMASAMGVYNINHPNDFMDKSVKAPVRYDKDDKFLEIDENFGNNWKPVSSQKPTPAPADQKSTLEDDDMPF
jgi:hypothetical protein